MIISKKVIKNMGSGASKNGHQRARERRQLKSINLVADSVAQNGLASLGCLVI